MKTQELIRLILAALFAALACVSTMVLQIPVFNGYIHPGDAFILLGAFLLGPLWGGAAAGIGSMLADVLTGYGVYAPGTLVIKFLMALVAGLIYKGISAKGKSFPAAILAGLCGEGIMVAGYFVYDAFVLSYGAAATVLYIPGNLIQGAFGLVVSIALLQILLKIPYVKHLGTV